MLIWKFAATSALAIAALSITAGTAYAAPGTTIQTDVLPGVHYTASVVDNSVVIKTDAGSLTTVGTQFQVLDGQGKLMAGLPLTYHKDGKEWPIAAKVEGNKATLTPSVNPKTAVATPDLKPVDATADFNAALSIASTQIGLAMAIGALVGTVIGATVGCVAGAVLGAALVPPIFLPGAAGGCLAGIGAGATIGIAVGTIVFGTPVAIVSAIQFYNTLYAPK